MTENIHNVSQRQWGRWNETARRQFNDVMEQLEDRTLHMHPKHGPVTYEQWQTIRWNAAWIAADTLRQRGVA